VPIYQQRGFGQKSGLVRFAEDDSHRVWGCPWHGKVVNGTLTHSAGTKSYPWLNFTARTVNCISAIPFSNLYADLSWYPRTAGQLSGDGATGHVWRTYGLLVGTKKRLYGQDTTVTGAPTNAYEVGYAAWLYAAPDGTVWRLSIPSIDTTTGNLHSGGTVPPTKDVVLKAQRFGLFRSRDSRGTADPVTYDYSKTLGMPFVGQTRASAIGYVGTMNLVGSKVMLYWCDPDCLTGGAGTSSYAGGTAQGTNYSGGPLAAWLIECSGTPGVDFAASITLHGSHDTAAYEAGTVSYLWLHSWVTPDGTVQDFKATGSYTPTCTGGGHAACDQPADFESKTTRVDSLITPLATLTHTYVSTGPVVYSYSGEIGGQTAVFGPYSSDVGCPIKFATIDSTHIITFDGVELWNVSHSGIVGPLTTSEPSPCDGQDLSTLPQTQGYTRLYWRGGMDGVIIGEPVASSFASASLTDPFSTDAAHYSWSFITTLEAGSLTMGLSGPGTVSSVVGLRFLAFDGGNGDRTDAYNFGSGAQVYV
jgi:hypothetical protein